MVPTFLVSHSERHPVFAGRARFLLKRNIITIFMSIELMLNAVNLTFVAFANYWNTHVPQSISAERPGLCFLCDGGGRRGSRRGTGHHHFCFPYP